MGWIRRTLFHFLRLTGGFRLAQHLTRHELRILGYHGFSVRDEHVLRPYVFMRLQTFERRLRILRRRGVEVVSLDEAILRLRESRLGSAETVITLDDGWASNLHIVPILDAYKYPACIYVTTEHLSATTEAFNVTVAYLMHASRKKSVTIRGLHPLLDGEYQIAADPESAANAIIAAASEIHRLSERQRLLAPLAASLGIDYPEFIRGNRFQFLNAAQIREVARRGLSIQMHSHSHCLPADKFDTTADEIKENRNAITELTGIEPVHFCYPSGEYTATHPEWLARLGVLSATTCDPGFNDARAPLLLLRRYLDSDSTSDIEFEAEIAGVRELLRRLRSRLRTSFAFARLTRHASH